MDEWFEHRLKVMERSSGPIPTQGDGFNIPSQGEGQRVSNQPVLCYVEGSWAYFTTQSLDEQWGDDWNDAPYEHNAGEPYEYYAHWDSNKSKDSWEIIKIAFEGYGLVQPCDEHFNSPYSVEHINQKQVPWLRSAPYASHNIQIWAGASPEEFIRLIQEVGGQVYTLLKQESKKGI